MNQDVNDNKKKDIARYNPPSTRSKRFSRGLMILGGLGVVGAMIAAPFTGGASLVALPYLIGATGLGTLGYAASNAVQRNNAHKRPGFFRGLGQFMTGLFKGAAILASIAAFGLALASIPLTMGASAGVLAPMIPFVTPLVSAIAAPFVTTASTVAGFFGAGAGFAALAASVQLGIGTAIAAVTGFLGALIVGRRIGQRAQQSLMTESTDDAQLDDAQNDRLLDNMDDRAPSTSSRSARSRPEYQTMDVTLAERDRLLADRSRSGSASDMRSAAASQHAPSSSEAEQPESNDRARFNQRG